MSFELSQEGLDTIVKSLGMFGQALKEERMKIYDDLQQEAFDSVERQYLKALEVISKNVKSEQAPIELKKLYDCFEFYWSITGTED